MICTTFLICFFLCFLRYIFNLAKAVEEACVKGSDGVVDGVVSSGGSVGDDDDSSSHHDVCVKVSNCRYYIPEDCDDNDDDSSSSDDICADSDDDSTSCCSLVFNLDTISLCYSDDDCDCDEDSVGDWYFLEADFDDDDDEDDDSISDDSTSCCSLVFNLDSISLCYSDDDESCSDNDGECDLAFESNLDTNIDAPFVSVSFTPLSSHTDPIECPDTISAPRRSSRLRRQPVRFADEYAKYYSK